MKCKLSEVIYGQNLTRANQKFALARDILKLQALCAFDTKANKLQVELVTAATRADPPKEQPNTYAYQTDKNFETCMDAMVNAMMPLQALKIHKKYMRHTVQKPSYMTTREFVTWYLNTNGELEAFPLAFNATQNILMDKVLQRTWSTQFHSCGQR